MTLELLPIEHLLIHCSSDNISLFMHGFYEVWVTQILFHQPLYCLNENCQQNYIIERDQVKKKSKQIMPCYKNSPKNPNARTIN